MGGQRCVCCGGASYRSKGWPGKHMCVNLNVISFFDSFRFKFLL